MGNILGDSPVFKEVIAILRPERWAAAKARLDRLPVNYSQRRVLGRRREGSLKYLPRTGTRPAGIHYLPQRMVCCEVEELLLDLVLAAFQSDPIGRGGDGCVFVLPIQAVIAIEEPQPEYAALPHQAPAEVMHAAGQ